MWSSELNTYDGKQQFQIRLSMVVSPRGLSVFKRFCLICETHQNTCWWITTHQAFAYLIHTNTTCTSERLLPLEQNRAPAVHGKGIRSSSSRPKLRSSSDCGWREGGGWGGRLWINREIWFINYRLNIRAPDLLHVYVHVPTPKPSMCLLSLRRQGSRHGRLDLTWLWAMSVRLCGEIVYMWIVMHICVHCI